MVGTQMTAQVNKQLTNISQKIVPEGMIVEEALPLLNVVQSSGIIAGYGNSHLRIVSSVTGGKNKVPQVDTKAYTQEVYQVQDHSLKDFVTKEDRVNVESPFDAEVDTMDELNTQLFLEKNFAFANTVTDTGVITNNVTLSGTSQYSDYDNSDPLGDFATARNSVFDNTGRVPDTVLMDRKTFNTLSTHPEMLRALGFADARPGGILENEMARAMQVERVLIDSSVYNAAKEGQADDVQAVFGRNIVFAVLPRSAARRQVSLGYRIQQFGTPRAVFRSDVDDPPETTRIIVRDTYELRFTNTDAGYLIKDTIA